MWGPCQQEAFEAVKDELEEPTVLALYDPQALSKVSADAFSFGLGTVLLQQQGGQEWRPLSYASRSMSETEKRYAQIEKKALAVTWACEKFNDYILGSTFLVESDHKPLVPLLSTKSLNDLPSRILRFRLRMNKYDYSIRHVAGKELYTADTLSRTPHSERLRRKNILNHTILKAMWMPSRKLYLQVKTSWRHTNVLSMAMRYVEGSWITVK